MSLLHQDTSNASDDAARGEEFTKGSSHLIIAGSVAAILVSLAIVLVFILGQKPPAVTGQVLSVWVHPHHTVTSGLDANGDQAPVETYDQVLVFYKLRLHNQSKDPVYLLHATANATLASGIQSDYAMSLIDYERIFKAYDNFPVPHDKGMALDTYIEPGQTVEGTFVSIFNSTKEQWDANKGLDFTVSFRYHPDLQLTSQAPVTER
jgi:hypothetical protein